jgi:hypothetical protein
MKQNQWRLLIAVTGLIIVLGGAWVLWFPPQSFPQTRIQPDGTRISLRAVSFGREHRVLLDAPAWKRVLAGIVPKRWARRFNLDITAITYTTPNESLLVLLDWEPPPGSLPMLHGVTLDDGHGNEFNQTLLLNPRQLGTNMTKAALFTVVPRQGDRLLLRVHSGDARTRTVAQSEFVIRNRLPKRLSLWREQSLPATGRDENIQYVLTGLHSFNPQSAVSVTGPSGFTRVSGQFYESGKPTTNWQIVGVEVMDEFGGSQQILGNKTRSNSTSFFFRARLSTGTVWRLRFALGQLDGFASTALWIVPDLPLEGLRRATFASVSNSIDGATLVVYDISGRPRSLKALVIPADTDQRPVLVRALIPSGRDIKTDRGFGLRHSNSSTFVFYDFPLGPTTNVSSVDATFAVTRLRYVEMLVRAESTETNPRTDSAFFR